MNHGSPTRPAAQLPPARTRFNRAGLAIAAANLFWLLLFSPATSGGGGGNDQRRRQAGQFRLPRLPHRPVQHPRGERAEGSARRFPDQQFRPLGPFHARLHGLPHGREGIGSRRQIAAAGLLRLPRQGGEGLRDEHPRHEPLDGRVRRGAMLGLPRLARHFAGEGPVVAGLQNEPAADVREVPQQSQSHARNTRSNIPEAASQYMDSIHGRALLKMGLIVAPSCNDCHGVHNIKRRVDRDSPINHAQRRQNLRQMPPRHRANLRQERPRPIARERRRARAGLH